MSFLRILLPIVVLTLGVAAFVLLYSTRPKALPVPPVEKVWNVATESIEIQDIAPTLRLYGIVESPRESQLTAAIASDVSQVSVLEGDGVDAGTAMVQLDDREASLLVKRRAAELAEVEAQISSEGRRHESDLVALKHERQLLALAEKAFERARRLADTKVGSQSVVDEAMQAVQKQAMAVSTREYSIEDHHAREAQLRARESRARTFLDQARLDLQRTMVLAPFNGRVTGVHVSVGDRVRAGDPLVDLYDTAHVEVRAQIPAAYLGRVRAALRAGIELRARGSVEGRDVALKLDRIAARVEPGRGGVDALFRVMDADDAELELGRTITLQLAMPEEARVVVVPVDAVYGRNRIYKLVEGRMQAVRIDRVGERVDAQGNTRVLVRSHDLVDGDQIIVSKIPVAIEGLRVEVIETNDSLQ